MNQKVSVWMTVSKQQKPVNKETGNQQDTEKKKKDAQHGERFFLEMRPEAGHGPAPGRLWRRRPSLDQ